MSGPHRNPDRLNTIGIVVVGICGAVLVYCTIIALQAFYMNDTSEIQNTADYGGNDTAIKAMKADQMRNVTEYGVNGGTAGTYHVPVEIEMAAVAAKASAVAKGGSADWTTTAGVSNCETTLPVPGRGHPDQAPGAIEGCPGAKVAPAAGSGAGSGSAAGTSTAQGGAAAGSNASDVGAGSGAGSGSASGAGAGPGTVAPTGSGGNAP